MTIEEDQQKVMGYINKFCQIPLRFGQYENGFPDLIEEEKTVKDKSLDNLIKIILGNSRNCVSKNALTKVFETYPDRYRSSLDIWRHLNFYKPDQYTIFDVMDCLFRIQEELYGQFCGAVLRRVFKLKIHPTTSAHYVRDEINTKDEYDLTFDQWKNINQIEKEN